MGELRFDGAADGDLFLDLEGDVFPDIEAEELFDLRRSRRSWGGGDLTSGRNGVSFLAGVGDLTLRVEDPFLEGRGGDIEAKVDDLEGGGGNLEVRFEDLEGGGGERRWE